MSCRGNHHAYDPRNQHDCHIVRGEIFFCSEPICPNREHRKASAAFLRDYSGLTVITASQQLAGTAYRRGSTPAQGSITRTRSQQGAAETPTVGIGRTPPISRRPSEQPDTSRAHQSSETQQDPEQNQDTGDQQEPEETQETEQEQESTEETEQSTETPHQQTEEATTSTSDKGKEREIEPSESREQIPQPPNPDQNPPNSDPPPDPSSHQTNMADNEDQNDSKLARPPQYNGEPEGFRSWFNAVKLYIRLNPKKFSTDEAKVAGMLSYMQEGHAGKWATLQIEAYLDKDEFPAYTDFLKLVRTQFEPVMLQEKARTKLDHITQGSRTVNEYNTEFRLVLFDAGLEDELEKVWKYKRGLKDSIRRQIEDLDRSTRPATAETWMTKASVSGSNCILS